MQHSHPDYSSYTLTPRSAQKQTRSQHRQWRRHHRGLELERQSGAMYVVRDCSLSPVPLRFCNSPLVEDGSDRSNDTSNFAFAPRALDRHNHHLHIGRQTIFAFASAALLLCSPSITSVANAAPSQYHSIHNSRAHSALFVSPVSRYAVINPSMSIQRKTPQQQRRPSPNQGTTWSNAVREKSELKASRFGVRRRVKSVLKKAKKRTGIENSSTVKNGELQKNNGESSFVRNGSFVQTGPNIVADAASIGGSGAVVVDEEGCVDAALDYISMGGELPVNGYNYTSGIGVTSGKKYEDPAILTKLAEEVIGAETKNGVNISLSPSSSADVPSTAPITFQQPEDNFVLGKKDVIKMKNGATQKTFREKEASIPREPLPFDLPKLTAEQSRRVVDGERVQFQDDMGRAGSGYVVWDVKAPASVVWDCLLDFKSYPQTITTVREVVMFTNTHLKEDYRAEKPVDFLDGTAAICKHGVPSVTRAQFSLSKFKLKIAAVHKYKPHPKGDYMIFTLDPASTNIALKYAKGIWYTQSNPDGKEGYTRVWLLCELKVSRLLPQWIVDYAAARAMPRATTWLKPQTEAAATLWLKDPSKI